MNCPCLMDGFCWFFVTFHVIESRVCECGNTFSCSSLRLKNKYSRALSFSDMRTPRFFEGACLETINERNDPNLPLSWTLLLDKTY